MKVLTIAVPAYNMAHWLPRCLDSMNDMRLNSLLEVIVVDDGSADDTLVVARQYEQRNPEIFRVATQPNGGHGAAVNTGMRLAQGKYFRIVDADDWVNTDALHNVLLKMRNMDCDLFVDEKTEIDVSTKAIRKFPLPENAQFGVEQPFSALMHPEYDTLLSMHTMAVRTQLLRDMGLQLLEHTFYVDMQYVIGVSAFARTACLMRERVYNYQVGDANQSVAAANYVRRYDQHDRVLAECIAFCERNAGRLPEGRLPYLRHALALLARSQLKIALLFDADRAQGRRRAKALREVLRNDHPAIWREVCSRYLSAMALNRFGMGEKTLRMLQKLRGGRRG